MPANFLSATAKAASAGYLPILTESVYRNISLYALADVNIRRATNTTQTTVLKATTMLNLGVVDGSDVEVEAVGGVATTVYVYGSHPVQ